MVSANSKTVSVVLATHNGAQYVEQQIKSICEQSLLPLELIISDDASTDDTIAIALAALEDSPFPVTIRRNRPALGFRDNFLTAALLARGDFIAFCDQDDIWSPTKLEMASRYFNDEDVSLIVHASDLIDQSSRKIGVFRQGIEETAVRSPLSYDLWDTFWGFSIVFRRELLDLANIEDRFIDYIAPNELIAHDRWITFLGQLVGRTVEISDILASYRQHQTNLYGAGSKKRSRPPLSVRERSEHYIAATAQMIEVLERIPDEAASKFRLFDRRTCREFLESALSQLQSRHRIYDSRSKSQAIMLFWRCARSGLYRNVHNGRVRWRSLGRDLQFAIRGF